MTAGYVCSFKEGPALQRGYIRFTNRKRQPIYIMTVRNNLSQLEYAKVESNVAFCNDSVYNIKNLNQIYVVVMWF